MKRFFLTAALVALVACSAPNPGKTVIVAVGAMTNVANLFTSLPAGKITIDSAGYSSFTADENGNHRYLLLPDVEKARAEMVRMTVPRP